MEKILIIDVEKCLACKSCEIACALAHSNSKVLEEAINESPLPQKRVIVESAEEFAVPLQCRHCEDAPCIEICPTGAIHRQSQEGPVIVSEELCIGCKLCMLICPLGVLQIGSQGRAIIKCDMCLERLEAGQQPACVESCPTKALKLVLLEDATKSKRRQAARKFVNETD